MKICLQYQMNTGSNAIGLMKLFLLQQTTCNEKDHLIFSLLPKLTLTRVASCEDAIRVHSEATTETPNTT